MFPSEEEDCRGFPLFSVAGSACNMFQAKDDDVSMVDAGSVVEVGSMLSMTTTATAAREGEGSTDGDGDGDGPSIMQRPSSSMRYKGVVLQQNGHWGAQIYAHHNRIWLGTFKSELAAAAAYDSAAIKLHRGDSHRNLPWNELTIHEPRFQEQFSTEAVLEMIRSGSYESRFAEYLRVMQSPQASPVAPPRGSPRSGIGSGGCGGGGSCNTCCEMFTKELTPSDVGKLNRLVIPKKHATRFFPAVSPESDDELLLEFQDLESRLWVFRYCYWKSSQSYVFTKGWNKFVKEKGLQAKDSVTFYRCEEREGPRRAYCMIEAVPCRQGRGQENGNVTFGLGLSYKIEVDEEEEEEEVISGPMAASGVTQGEQEMKGVKIFGVWVS
ncbi:AP2/ERF and B3 domain-containing transcription factor At1g50680-like isoform X1 [Phoenix dactylifera]|uniref:AP2/ERF and B3 domain-containing transcription factor At1g50680-like isoform X1 n=1 Tax=Phoenix dactylifera TaxID=42345 RepID=A0A8B7CIP9_PHODC|nr:AP2/ERF and B3 domain-containing transcription factor At1g50680-like isoform X1 [Phoenix dactylifera]